MKYILSDLEVRTKKGLRCEHCNKIFWKGFHLKPLEQDDEFRICKECGRNKLNQKLKEKFNDNGLIRIFDSRYYKCK